MGFKSDEIDVNNKSNVVVLGSKSTSPILKVTLPLPFPSFRSRVCAILSEYSINQSRLFHHKDTDMSTTPPKWASGPPPTRSVTSRVHEKFFKFSYNPRVLEC